MQIWYDRLYLRYFSKIKTKISLVIKVHFMNQYAFYDSTPFQRKLSLRKFKTNEYQITNFTYVKAVKSAPSKLTSNDRVSASESDLKMK